MWFGGATGEKIVPPGRLGRVDVTTNQMRPIAAAAARNKDMDVTSETIRKTTDDAASSAARANNCRFCGARLKHSLVDLGMSPLCETYLRADQLNQMEPFYPLHVFVCERCFLAQLQEYVRVEEIFTEYAYFSSYSESWLEHARIYSDLMVERFGLGAKSRSSS